MASDAVHRCAKRLVARENPPYGILTCHRCFEAVRSLLVSRTGNTLHLRVMYWGRATLGGTRRDFEQGERVSSFNERP